MIKEVLELTSEKFKEFVDNIGTGTIYDDSCNFVLSNCGHLYGTFSSFQRLSAEFSQPAVEYIDCDCVDNGPDPRVIFDDVLRLTKNFPRYCLLPTTCNKFLLEAKEVPKLQVLD